MDKQKIGKIILSKALELPLKRYLAYVERTLNGSTKTPCAPFEFCKGRLYYARIEIKNGIVCFRVLDKRLEDTHPLKNVTDNKTACSLRWINTRNKFSLHILKSILDYQRKYWFSGKEADLKPLTLKRFLSLYPLQYLDQYRLSRLSSNLPVIYPQDRSINLKNLFVSKKSFIHTL